MRDAVFRGLLKETTYEALDWFSALVNVVTSLISMTLTVMERAFLESDKARATLPQLLRQKKTHLKYWPRIPLRIVTSLMKSDRKTHLKYWPRIPLRIVTSLTNLERKSLTKPKRR